MRRVRPRRSLSRSLGRRQVSQLDGTDDRIYDHCVAAPRSRSYGPAPRAVPSAPLSLADSLLRQGGQPSFSPAETVGITAVSEGEHSLRFAVAPLVRVGVSPPERAQPIEAASRVGQESELSAVPSGKAAPNRLPSVAQRHHPQRDPRGTCSKVGSRNLVATLATKIVGWLSPPELHVSNGQVGDSW